MAFVAEDGTGKANSNSYVDLAYANTYFADRNVASWGPLTDSVKQAALIGATEYIEKRWFGQFRGQRFYPDVQALEFPRNYAIYSGMYSPYYTPIFFLPVQSIPTGPQMPVPLLKAACEYALRASSNGELMPDLALDATGRVPSKISETVGPITEETVYAQQGPSASVFLFRPYPAADTLIAQLIMYQGGVVRN